MKEEQKQKNKFGIKTAFALEELGIEGGLEEAVA